MDAAYNLARWLIDGECETQQVLQEALVRAMRRIDGLPRERARTWLLMIVRQACISWLTEKPPMDRGVPGDDDVDDARASATSTEEPPVAAIGRSGREPMNAALASLPVVYREVLVLRELEDLSYAEIAQITEVSVGTVMSRLARARGSIELALGQPSLGVKAAPFRICGAEQNRSSPDIEYLI